MFTSKATEAAAALAVLGYSTQEVQMALKGVDVENLPLEEIIRQGLEENGEVMGNLHGTVLQCSASRGHYCCGAVRGACHVDAAGCQARRPAGGDHCADGMPGSDGGLYIGHEFDGIGK